MKKNKQDLPKIGEYYHFFDDDKTSPNRHYICKIEKIIPFEEGKNIILNTPRGETFKDGKFESYFIDMSLEDIWKDEIKQCNWVYDKETDYFIEASCPVYDKNNLWFARSKEGGWFSMDVQCYWQAGKLDVDGSRFKEIIEFWKNDKYTSEESRKAIVESYLERKYEK